MYKLGVNDFYHDIKILNSINEHNQSIKLRLDANQAYTLEEFQNIENEKIQISDLYYLRGDTFASLRNYNQALKDFEKALEFNSKNIDAKNSIIRISKIK